MAFMIGLVITLEEDVFYYVSNFAVDSRTEALKYRSNLTVLNFSSSEVLGKNCRLQLAGLGKKREETFKPTCFRLLDVESDFGTTTSDHRQIIHNILRPLRR